VNKCLMPVGEMACKKMRIDIPAQEHDLEKKHTRGPDRRRASEPGKNIPGDDGLNLKEQKGTEKDRQGVGKNGQQNPGSRTRRLCRFPGMVAFLQSRILCDVSLGLIG